MPNIRDMIQTCADTTKRKGFDTSQHATQIALIATEVAEALECVNGTINTETLTFVDTLQTAVTKFELYRNHHKGDHSDNSRVRNQQHLNEELADIVIRVFSYVGGNGQADGFLQELIAKIDTNKGRPDLHGKAF